MKKKAVLAVVTTFAMVFAFVGTALAGVSSTSGFEANDGDLAVNSTFDWNGFAPTAWTTGTAPYRTTAPNTTSGWKFLGIEDAQAVTSDTAFAGGVKQDDECPSVITQKADNKADLKRIYLASKTGANGHTYLVLAWVRIPQNTTSPSAHVAFEFNSGDTGCPAGSDSLVHRTFDDPTTLAVNEADMLIVYDFEGGSTNSPTLRLERWVGSGSCEVGSHSPPCWGPATVLTDDPNTAEAKVNTGGSVLDEIGPDGTATLGTNEFGEAGIDLTNAGVFPIGTCNSFGTAFGVSRTSGNSATAQMKDLDGPAPFNLTNCGEVKIIKHTDPRGINQNFNYSSTIPASSTCLQDATPVAFTLNDNGNTTSDSNANTEDCTNVPAGSYTVTEGAEPSGFVLESLTCTASGTGSSGAQDGTVPEQANITIAGGGVVTCTYTNQQQLGAIKITKTGKDKSCTAAGGTCQAIGVRLLTGATFSITKGGTPITGSPFTTTNGVVCVDNLAFGDYVVTETAAPTGYKIDTTAGQTVTVDNNAKCSDSPYVGEAKAFGDTPLSQIRVTFHSKAGVGVTTATIQCTGDLLASNLPDNDTGRLLDDLSPGTYACTVVIDP